MQVVLFQKDIISEPYSDQHISRLELSKPRYGTMNKTLSGVFFIQQTNIQANDIPLFQNHILAIKNDILKVIKGKLRIKSASDLC